MLSLCLSNSLQQKECLPIAPLAAESGQVRKARRGMLRYRWNNRRNARNRGTIREVMAALCLEREGYNDE